MSKVSDNLDQSQWEYLKKCPDEFRINLHINLHNNPSPTILDDTLAHNKCDEFFSIGYKFKIKYQDTYITLFKNLDNPNFSFEKYMEYKANLKLSHNHKLLYPDNKELCNLVYGGLITFTIHGSLELDITSDIPTLTFTELNWPDYISYEE